MVLVGLFDFCYSKGSLGVFLLSLIRADRRLLWGSVSVEFHTLLYLSKQTPWRRSLSTNRLLQLFSENINLPDLLVVLSMWFHWEDTVRCLWTSAPSPMLTNRMGSDSPEMYTEKAQVPQLQHLGTTTFGSLLLCGVPLLTGEEKRSLCGKQHLIWVIWGHLGKSPGLQVWNL